MKQGDLTIPQKRIQQAISSILEAIGENPQRQGLLNTPKRVASMYAELFSGVGLNPETAIDAVFDQDFSGPIILRDISFYSICEHHLLPFFGSAHVAYIPNGKISGLSKLTRALEVIAHRPQLQERLTNQLADTIFAVLNPKGVAVEVEAEHLCISMRGVNKPGSHVITAIVRGQFENCDLDSRGLLALLRKK
jgi:GTP cyclohydrolase I